MYSRRVAQRADMPHRLSERIASKATFQTALAAPFNLEYFSDLCVWQ